MLTMKQSTKKSNMIKPILVILLFCLLFYGLYYTFRDSLPLIVSRLKEASPFFVLLMLFFGFFYYFLDSVNTTLVVRTQNKDFTLKNGITTVFLGFVTGVMTFGSGTKPAHTYYLSKHTIPIGMGFSLCSLPYVFHKLTVVLYATIMLIFQGKFLKRTYQEAFSYLTAGYVFSFLIIAVLILLFTSKKFHALLFYLPERFLHSPKWLEKLALLKKELQNLQEESVSLLKKKSLCASLVGINFLKLTCWYILPFLACYAIHSKTVFPITEIIATSALMQLIIGVIPITGGMVSAEVVYLLLYNVLFGEVSAASTMILYRAVTYYLPIFYQMPFVLYKGYRLKKTTSHN